MFCYYLERSASDVKTPSDTAADGDISCGTEPAGDASAVKCDDNDNDTQLSTSTTSTDAESLPPEAAPEVHSSPSHHSSDMNPQPSSPADAVPVTCSEPSTTDTSPTYSDTAEGNSNSAVSLPTDTQNDLSSTEPAADSI